MQATHVRNQTTWKEVYQEALLELDPKEFPAKLEAAHKAVRERLYQLSNGTPDRREMTQLEDANRTISLLSSSVGKADIT
jgi:hypothetical protein